MLMRELTSSTQLATFLFVDSQWHEPHDAVQCRAHGSTFKFLFEFQTEFFSNFLFEFQVVQESNRLTIEGPLYNVSHVTPSVYICMHNGRVLVYLDCSAGTVSFAIPSV